MMCDISTRGGKLRCTRVRWPENGQQRALPNACRPPSAPSPPARFGHHVNSLTVSLTPRLMANVERRL